MGSSFDIEYSSILIKSKLSFLGKKKTLSSIQFKYVVVIEFLKLVYLIVLQCTSKVYIRVFSFVFIICMLYIYLIWFSKSYNLLLCGLASISSFNTGDIEVLNNYSYISF